MPTLILPIIPTNPGLNYSQEKVLEKLQEYLAAKNPVGTMPFNSNSGWCSGLVAYWLYSKRIGEEGRFIYKIEHVLSWDKTKLQDIGRGRQEDPLIEEFINDVAFLQYDKKLRDDIGQDDLPSSFQLLLNDHYPRVNKAEFKILFVFNNASLSKLINDTVFENKMLRIENGMHALGLMLSDGVYYLCDPGDPALIITFNLDQKDALANTIFKALAKFCLSQRYIALYMAIFDIDADAVIRSYPSSLEYCKNLLKDPHYKNAVLTHANIFYLGMRHEDYKILDLLFALGYKYIPWKLNNTTEFEEAIIYNNVKKFKYLLDCKIPIDYAAPHGITPLARAIYIHNTMMVYNLIAAGANPNIAAEKDYPMFYFVLKWGNVADLTLLLAAGLKLKTNYIPDLQKKYSAVQINDIKSHALLLQAKLNLDKSSVQEELLKTINKIIEKITKKKPHEFTQQEKQDIDVITSTLNQLLLTKSDITEAILAAKSKIDDYLGNSNYQPKNLFFGQQSQGEQDELSYEKDILPLLNLKLG